MLHNTFELQCVCVRVCDMSLEQVRTCFDVPRSCVFSQTIKKTLLQLCIIAMHIYYIYS